MVALASLGGLLCCLSGSGFGRFTFVCCVFFVSASSSASADDDDDGRITRGKTLDLNPKA